MRRRLLIGVVLVALGGAVLLHVVRPQEASAVLYTVPLSRDAGTHPAVVMDAVRDRTVIANLDGTTLTVLQTSTGHLVTTVPVGRAPSALALDTSSGHVFVVNSHDNTVSLLDLRSDHVLRTIAMNGGLFRITCDQTTERVALDVTDGTVKLLDARSGRILRTIPNPARPVDTIYAWEGHVAVSDAGYLQVFDEATGAVQYRASGSVVVGDAYAGRLLAVEYGAAALDVLDARDGALLSTSYPLHSGPPLDLVAADERRGRFFVGDAYSARVLTFDAKSGNLVRSETVQPPPVALTADPQRGRVYAASDTRLTLLDAQRGRIIGSVPLHLPGHLRELLLDASSGHLLFITADERIPGRDAWDWVPGVLRRWLPLPQHTASARVSASLIMLDPSIFKLH